MIIGKKEKGNLMRLYRSSLNEIESFSMLILSVEETKQLLAKANWLKQADGSMLTAYENKDKLDIAWHTIAVEHQKANAEFTDVSLKYKSPVLETSMLIRDDLEKSIRISKRRESDVINTINIICINNNDKELFFQDCHDSVSYAETKKYLFKYAYDPDLYLKWSDFMNNAYKNGLRLTKDERARNKKESN